jgi:UDP-N-acetylmuramoyl-tripeptide--D-alanyl-D-alanine ligase
MDTINSLYELFLSYPKITTDTRKDVAGSIFFALSGDNFNGNRFAQDAIEKGAAIAVIDDVAYAKMDSCLMVNNTLETLQELAILHRSKVSATVFGITGTNGKTTTKELIASVLQTCKNITYTSGNYNNHIGVPLSVLEIKEDTEIAVIEMGANHIGEIARLCSIARPDVGIITNIGKAHLEGFGSYEGVITAKSELYQYLRDHGGTVLFNHDDHLLVELSQGINRLSYGSSDADISGKITSHKPVLSIDWQYGDIKEHCKSNLYGRYNFYNILAAVATGLYFDLKPENINHGITGYFSENNRSQLIRTATNNVYMDAYNANPVSMAEAISSFKEQTSEDAWLILGDMFELGDVSKEEHQKIIDMLKESTFSNILLVGKEFYSLRETSPYPVFQATSDISNYLVMHPVTESDILVKGSRGMQLESLLKNL